MFGEFSSPNRGYFLNSRSAFAQLDSRRQEASNVSAHGNYFVASWLKNNTASSSSAYFPKTLRVNDKTPSKLNSSATICNSPMQHVAPPPFLTPTLASSRSSQGSPFLFAARQAGKGKLLSKSVDSDSVLRALRELKEIRQRRYRQATEQVNVSVLTEANERRIKLEPEDSTNRSELPKKEEANGVTEVARKRRRLNEEGESTAGPAAEEDTDDICEVRAIFVEQRGTGKRKVPSSSVNADSTNRSGIQQQDIKVNVSNGPKENGTSSASVVRADGVSVRDASVSAVETHDSECQTDVARNRSALDFTLGSECDKSSTDDETVRRKRARLPNFSENDDDSANTSLNWSMNSSSRRSTARRFEPTATDSLERILQRKQIQRLVERLMLADTSSSAAGATASASPKRAVELRPEFSLQSFASPTTTSTTLSNTGNSQPTFSKPHVTFSGTNPLSTPSLTAATTASSAATLNDTANSKIGLSLNANFTSFGSSQSLSAAANTNNQLNLVLLPNALDGALKTAEKSEKTDKTNESNANAGSAPPTLNQSVMLTFGAASKPASTLAQRVTDLGTSKGIIEAVNLAQNDSSAKTGPQLSASGPTLAATNNADSQAAGGMKQFNLGGLSSGATIPPQSTTSTNATTQPAAQSSVFGSSRSPPQIGIKSTAANQTLSASTDLKLLPLQINVLSQPKDNVARAPEKNAAIVVSKPNAPTGSDVTNPVNKSAFSFGAVAAPVVSSSGTSTAASTSQFAFGGTAQTDTKPTTSLFAGATSPLFGATPSAGSGQQQQSASANTTPTSSLFGKSAPSTDVKPPTFSFGGAPTNVATSTASQQPQQQTTATPLGASTGTAAAATGSFNFSKSVPTSLATTTSNATAQVTPTFSFGSKPAAPASQNAFGSSTGDTKPAFGTTAATGGQSAFGTVATTSQPAFGSAGASKPLFGSASSTSQFGSATSGTQPIGTTAGNTQPAFGTSAFSSSANTTGTNLSFGANTKTSQPVFGSTSTAPTLSFGTPQTSTAGSQPSQTFGNVAGSLFGAPAANTTSATAGPAFFGSANATSTNNSGPTLFGSANAVAGTSTATPALFGSTNANAGTSNTGSSPFGSANSSANNNATGSLFGSSNANTKPAGPSLFGSTNSSGSTNAVGSLFGSANANTNTNSAGSSLFGSSTSATGNGAATSLFGTGPKPAALPGSTGGNAPSTFIFGASGNAASAQGQNANAANPVAFSFGGAPAPATQPQTATSGNKSVFSFGAPATSQSQPFQFGASAQPAQASAPPGSTVFQFGSQPAANTNASGSSAATLPPFIAQPFGTANGGAQNGTAQPLSVSTASFGAPLGGQPAPNNSASFITLNSGNATPQRRPQIMAKRRNAK